MATQLAMGPWYVRDVDRPFMPGFNEAILRHQVASGRIKPDTIVRGPTTHQFWNRADRTPGLSRLLGKCHACSGNVSTNAQQCGVCLTDLSLPDEVDRLGLAYTEPAQRQKVQADINAQRNAPTAPKPAATAIDPDLLQPVAPQSFEDEEDSEHDEPTLLGAGLDHRSSAQEGSTAEVAEDLWQSDAPVAARRRVRRSGPDPIVLGLGVLLLVVVSIGLFVMVTSGKKDDNTGTTDPTTISTKPVERTLDQVTRIGSPTRSAYDQLREQEVPEPFAAAVSQAGQLIGDAEADQERERYTEAYEKFAKADALLKPLPAEIAKWLADAELRAQVTAQMEEVKRVQGQATAAQAEQYAKSAFSTGTLKLSEAQAAIDKGSLSQAKGQLDAALTSFQQALDTAQAAAGALEARATLIAAMEKAASEQTLRQFASASVDRLNTLRQRGTEQFNGLDYTQAKQAFEEALASLRKAEQAVELAKYRKYYAYQAGYQSAGLLLAVAAGDSIDNAALTAVTELYSRLQLTDNPASGLQAGTQADYAQWADKLVNVARNAITGQHGEKVQASYHAGFQTRIIEQSLLTDAFTDDQQKRIHQALRSFQDQAIAAGWDVVKLNPVVDEVREANRKAELGKAPEQTRAAFAVLMKPMQQRESATRLMDPVLSPSAPNDPELFPNRGSIGS